MPGAGISAAPGKHLIKEGQAGTIKKETEVPTLDSSWLLWEKHWPFKNPAPWPKCLHLDPPLNIASLKNKPSMLVSV